METLTNFLTLLTTENELATKIFNAPTVVIEALISYYLISIILDINFSKLQSVIYIVFLSIVSLISEFLIPEPINVFVNYICIFILLKLLLKKDILHTILALFIPTIVFALSSTLILNPFLKMFNVTYEQNRSIPIYQASYLFALYIINIIILFIIKIKKLKLNILKELTSTNQKVISINIILGFLVLCIQAILTVFYLNIVPIGITILNFICLFIYFFISFYSLNRTMKLQVTSKNLETAENYNETLTYLYDNVKAFKHDFDNMVFVIGGFIENKDIDKLTKYYRNLEKDCERVNNIALLNPTLINDSGIYNLLMSKYKKASEYNIEIKFEYFFDLQKLHMPIYDFSRILGILLDNSLEAAKDSEEKIVNIIFRDSGLNKTQIISIENSYSNKDVDTSLIFEKGKTSKENHTGMGLWEVRQILNRNNNVNLITDKNENFFKQTLEIYY